MPDKDLQNAGYWLTLQLVNPRTNCQRENSLPTLGSPEAPPSRRRRCPREYKSVWQYGFRGFLALRRLFGFRAVQSRKNFRIENWVVVFGSSASAASSDARDRRTKEASTANPLIRGNSVVAIYVRSMVSVGRKISGDRKSVV